MATNASQGPSSARKSHRTTGATATSAAEVAKVQIARDALKTALSKKGRLVYDDPQVLQRLDTAAISEETVAQCMKHVREDPEMIQRWKTYKDIVEEQGLHRRPAKLSSPSLQVPCSGTPSDSLGTAETPGTTGTGASGASGRSLGSGSAGKRRSDQRPDTPEPESKRQKPNKPVGGEKDMYEPLVRIPNFIMTQCIVFLPV